MEEKILNVIQHIRSKCKKRVKSQRIDNFINKGTLSPESNSFQDFMVGLEIDSYISKRGKGKSTSYFVRKEFIDSSSNEKNEGSNNEMFLHKVHHFLSLRRFRSHENILKMIIYWAKKYSEKQSARKSSWHSAIS